MSLLGDMSEARKLGITYGEYISKYKAPKQAQPVKTVIDEGIPCIVPETTARMWSREPNMKIIYPVLREWILKNCRNSIYVFSDMLERSPSSAYNWLYGRHETTQGIINAVLALTGLTYEEAFRREK